MDKIANARRLRQERTDAERKLWSILRGRKLDGVGQTILYELNLARP